MAYLSAAVALVGLLCLLDLLLTVGVIRRLREQTSTLADLQQAGGSTLPGPGTSVAAFHASTTDGEPATLSTDDETLVGIFSSSCEPCRTLLPGFVDHAGGVGRSRTLAVIVGTDGETEPMRQALEGVARVVLEEHGGAVSGAFGTTMFPSVFVVGKDGRITASGHDLRALGGRPAGTPV